MSLNINAQGFSQARLPMNLSERSMLAGSGGIKEASKSASAATSVQAPVAKSMPRFRTLTPPAAAPAPKPTLVAAARNPYQARSARSGDDFAIVAENTPAELSVVSVDSNTSSINAANPMTNPMADRIKDIQSMATKLGYVELSEGAITKAIQNRSSLLANYVV